MRKEAAFGREVASQDPSFGTQVFSVGDGVAILGGPGLFVNRALAVGIDQDVDAAMFDAFEQRCAVVGVPAVIEVSEVTRRDVVAALERRGYRAGRQTSVVDRAVSQWDQRDSADPTVVVSAVGDREVAVWKDVAARGWGHDEVDRRRVSDLFADVSHAIERPGLLLARSADDGRPLGCAMLHVSEGVATLGGMATLPHERQRGVQSALLRHRIRLAADMACDVATSSAAPGSTSERNLLRHGFAKSHARVEFTLQTTAV